MNLLNNSSFEGPYIQHENEVKVAPDWMPFFSGGEAPEGGERCYRPEYKPVLRSLAPYRVYSGDTAQCWFVRWKVMDAGVYQTVQVPVGALMTFRAQVHGWCSQSDDPHKADGELYVRLGMDLQGGMDAFAPTVLWTNWERVTAEYQPLEMQAVADAPYCTVFVRAWNKWRLSHNDLYLDAATLEVDGSVPPPSGDYVTRTELAAAFRALAATFDR